MLENVSTTEYNNFYKSLQFILRWEGGYVNNPDDPGGETKYGISKRSYPDLDIRNLSPEMAAEIYYRDYWLKSFCNVLDMPLCTCVFDTAINCGVKRAVEWTKQSGGQVNAFLDLRKNHYVSLVYHNPKMGQFLKGWLNRLGDLQKFAQISQTPEVQANS